MSQQPYNAAFRTSNNEINIFDLTQPGAGVVSAWTLGGTLIDKIQSLSQPWTIQSVAVTIGLSLAPGTDPIYGRLGKVIAGLTPNLDTVTQRGSIPWVNPQLPLPDDLSLLTTLYDGEIDSSPGLTAPANVPSQPVQTWFLSQINLPQPLKVYPGQSIGIGLWMTPSLVQMGPPNSFVGLVVRRARYTLYYLL